MKIKCLHGYFIFQETRLGQVSDFMARFGFDLVSVGSYYTFDFLAEAPKYSIKGKSYLGFTSIKNFEGEPWEVFEQNGIVFDFSRDIIMPIASVVQPTSLSLAGNKFISPGLILPGSTTAGGQRVKDYSAWYSRDTTRFLYSEVGYV